jgi:hypothetical protein
MKKFFLKTIVVVLVVGIVYVFFLSVVKTDTAYIRVIESLRTGKVVHIVRPCAGGWAFAWQGSFPWWFQISDIPARRTADFRIRIAVPELSNLKEDYYHAWIPLHVTYRVDANKFTDATALGGGGRGVDDLVKRYFENGLKGEMDQYLTPAYQREALLAQVNAILDKTKKSIGEELDSSGITLARARISGAVVLPDRQVYAEGLTHAADLRKVDKANEKELLDLRSSVEREKIRNGQLYAKLLEISKIIKAYPDILKYIYIDKMGPNVKVILSPDTSGVPQMLEKEKTPAKGKPREIDNLR